jgi:hypothetical protein
LKADLFQPQYDDGSDPFQGFRFLSEQWAEPVWLLHGRDAGGAFRFTAYIRALLLED